MRPISLAPSRRTALAAAAGLILAGVSSRAVPDSGSFRRGDANTDGRWDISDASYTLNFLFLNGPAPACDDAADTNDDGAVDMSDAVWLLWFLFAGAAPPPPPAGFCGPDPTEDALACDGYTACPPVDFAGFVKNLIAASPDGEPAAINDINLCFDDNTATFTELCPIP